MGLYDRHLEILKKLTLLMAATIGAIFLIAWSLSSFGFRSPIFALVVNWMLLSWIATLTQVVPLSFPTGYYQARFFERSGQLYERVGIRLVRKFLRRGPLRILSLKMRIPKRKTVSALRDLENEMRKAETIHVLAFLLMLFVIGYVAINGWLDAVIWMSLFNLLINPYPIMLQRYNRIKLRELICRQAG